MLPSSKKSGTKQRHERLGCRSPRLVALVTSGALTKLKSAANSLPYAIKVALGLAGHCHAQSTKVARCRESPETRLED